MVLVRSLLLVVLAVMLPASRADIAATQVLSVESVFSNAIGVTATWQQAQYLVCDAGANSIVSVDPTNGDTSVFASDSDVNWDAGMSPQHIVMADEPLAYFSAQSPNRVMKLNMDNADVEVLIEMAFAPTGIARYWNDSSDAWNLLVADRETKVASYDEQSGAPTGWSFSYPYLENAQGISVSRDGRLSIADPDGMMVFIVDIATNTMLFEGSDVSTDTSWSPDGEFVVIHDSQDDNMRIMHADPTADPNDWSDESLDVSVPAGFGAQVIGIEGKLVITTFTGLVVLMVPTLACPSCVDPVDEAQDDWNALTPDQQQKFLDKIGARLDMPPSSFLKWCETRTRNNIF